MSQARVPVISTFAGSLDYPNRYRTWPHELRWEDAGALHHRGHQPAVTPTLGPRKRYIEELLIFLEQVGRKKKQGEFSGTLRVGLLAGALSLNPFVVLAQSQDVHEIHQNANDWAQNWSESWRARIKKRHSRFENFFNWQLSENTLLSFYGQLNLMYLNYDDGFDTITSVRDNANSPGRLGLRLETDLNNGTGIFANIETGLRRTDYDSLFGIGPPEETTDWNRTLLRKAEIRLSVPSVGYFSFGQGNMAADGITGFDFSNTTVTATNGVGDTASGESAVFTDGTISS